VLNFILVQIIDSFLHQNGFSKSKNSSCSVATQFDEFYNAKNAPIYKINYNFGGKWCIWLKIAHLMVCVANSRDNRVLA